MALSVPDESTGSIGRSAHRGHWSASSRRTSDGSVSTSSACIFPGIGGSILAGMLLVEPVQMADLGDRRVESFQSMADSILALPGGVRLVAVDGYGGAGKSTFATRLAAALGGAAVVHTDDFATGEPGVEWWPRLEREVIVPLSAGATARYRRWDWEGKRLAEWHAVEPMPAVVIEGVSSARRAAADRLACAIWVDAPAELRLERGLERDGREARPSWDAWMAEEDAHFTRDGTRARCDLVVDGNPGVEHDPETEFVRIGPGL